MPPSLFGAFLTTTLVFASFIARPLTGDDTLAQTLLIAGFCTTVAYPLTVLFWVTNRSRTTERN